MMHAPRYRRSTGLPGGKRRRFRLPYPVLYAVGAVAGLTVGTVLGSIVNYWLYGIAQ